MTMQLQLVRKGATYSADCSRCGCTVFTHEWANPGHNDWRDAMQNGTLACYQCGHFVDPDTFRELGRMYACRYTMPGYLDCTEWEYGRNKRTLLRNMRKMYGD